MDIRKAIERDIPTLIQIVIEYKKEQNILFDVEQIEDLRIALINSIRNDENTLLVTTNSEGNSIKGFVNFHILDFPLILGKELYISDLVIKRDVRGQGRGSSLLKYVEEIAYNQKCKRIMLNNLKDSDAYRREFYKKKGFIERKNIANYVKHL